MREDRRKREEVGEGTCHGRSVKNGKREGTQLSHFRNAGMKLSMKIWEKRKDGEIFVYM